MLTASVVVSVTVTAAEVCFLVVYGDTWYIVVVLVLVRTVSIFVLFNFILLDMDISKLVLYLDYIAIDSTTSQ